ncbi:hypothetical protein [Brevibacillus sp. FIR094]|uniref:hypothetical protein n=1 Tax=Brevibacillus sp. FIR094 TaxID=3134809 RepID=UPI003D21D2CC
MSNRFVSISGTIQVQDWEAWPADNEHASGNFSKILFVVDAQPQAFAIVPTPKICAGGDIWPAFDLTAGRGLHCFFSSF